MVSFDQNQILLAFLREKTLIKSYSLLADIIDGHAIDVKSNQTFISCDKANGRITYIVRRSSIPLSNKIFFRL